MNVRYEASFEKDLKNIRDKSLLKRIKAIIGNVKKADDAKQIKNLKKLRGYETFYRIKLGDYRVGIEIIKDEVIFTRFLHRREVYRYFP
ncbi:MAG TPA: type II toxin-antitoxin system RelE/ParE family toxin [Pyrinomonadaceae bacterium]|nr:type II toxin-antitoxin system RelE/ParE family toxin [Pyrinomonadaceae bacterium]